MQHNEEFNKKLARMLNDESPKLCPIVAGGEDLKAYTFNTQETPLSDNIFTLPVPWRKKDEPISRSVNNNAVSKAKQCSCECKRVAFGLPTTSLHPQYTNNYITSQPYSREQPLTAPILLKPYGDPSVCTCPRLPLALIRTDPITKAIAKCECGDNKKEMTAASPIIETLSFKAPTSCDKPFSAAGTSVSSYGSSTKQFTSTSYTKSTLSKSGFCSCCRKDIQSSEGIFDSKGRDVSKIKRQKMKKVKKKRQKDVIEQNTTNLNITTDRHKLGKAKSKTTENKEKCKEKNQNIENLQSTKDKISKSKPLSQGDSTGVTSGGSQPASSSAATSHKRLKHTAKHESSSSTYSTSTQSINKTTISDETKSAEKRKMNKNKTADIKYNLGKDINVVNGSKSLSVNDETISENDKHSSGKESKYYDESNGSNKDTENKHIEISKTKPSQVTTASVGGMYPGNTVGHRTCCLPFLFVPPDMGWLWNLCEGAGTIKPGLGWKPGAIRADVAYMMAKYKKIPRKMGMEESKPSLGTKPDCQCMCLNKEVAEEKVPVVNKPTLQLQKTKGQYMITMNPPEENKGGRRKDESVLLSFNRNYQDTTDSVDHSSGETSTTTVTSDSMDMDYTSAYGLHKQKRIIVQHAVQTDIELWGEN